MANGLSMSLVQPLSNVDVLKMRLHVFCVSRAAKQKTILCSEDDWELLKASQELVCLSFNL